MSRLYLLIDDYLGNRAIDADTLASLLRAFLDSHHDLADRARIGIRFDPLVRRNALRSGNSGWRAYPVSIDAELSDEGFRLQLGTEVVYSSTCPASAALSRQLIQQQFANDFAIDVSRIRDEARQHLQQGPVTPSTCTVICGALAACADSMQPRQRSASQHRRIRLPPPGPASAPGPQA